MTMFAIGMLSGYVTTRLFVPSFISTLAVGGVVGRGPPQPVGYVPRPTPDHGVSEALYLQDPDGNGVELYRDRPQEEWPRTPEGGLAMVTRPLDVEGLLAELDQEETT